ncbi:MAG TPA: DUF2269 family protein [Acidimicrobiia bacterium]
MERTLVTIHILSAAVWIGTGVFFMYAGPRFRSIGGPAVAGWIQVALGAIPRFVSPAALLTVLSGIALVMLEEAWGWGDQFVWIGLAVFVVVLSIGIGWSAPNMRRALAALETKDMPTVGASMKRVATGGLVIVALLMFAEFAMVFRLGAG